MEDNFERDEKGLTFGDICRIAFSQKWLALAIVIIITVAASLGMYYSNKSKEEYSSTFHLQLPDTAGSTLTVYTYPDGSTFYFTDLKERKNLENASKRAGLEGLDIEKMTEKGDISIERTIIKIDETVKTGSVYEFNYTLTVKTDYFKSEKQARSFIEAVVSTPREYIKSINFDFDKGLEASKTAATYEEKLTLLKNQTLFIKTKYEKLVETFGDSFILENGKSLGGYMAEVEAYLEKDLFSELIKSEDASASTPSEDYKKAIAEVVKTVEKFTDDIQKIVPQVYGEMTKVDFLSSKVVELKGGKSIIKIAIICFAVGVVAAAIIAFIVGYAVKQAKDRRKNSETAVAVPADGDKKEE